VAQVVVCTQINTENIYIHFGQSLLFLNVQLVMRIVPLIVKG